MNTKIHKSANKIVVLCTLLLAIITNAQTKSPFYASVNTSYNYGTGAPNVGGTEGRFFTFGLLNGDVNSYSMPKLNLGNGFKAGINVGYEINSHIAVELGADYLLGSKTYTKLINNSNNLQCDIQAKMLQIKPTLVLKAGFERINPYTKIGMLIGSGKITDNYINIGSTRYDKQLELTGGTPIGFSASVGTLYKWNDKISLFGELNLVCMTYAPTKGKYTKYLIDGVDRLSSLNTSDKEFEFANNIPNGAQDPNQPLKIEPISFSMNSIGLNIGMQYHF